MKEQWKFVRQQEKLSTTTKTKVKVNLHRSLLLTFVIKTKDDDWNIFLKIFLISQLLN